MITLTILIWCLNFSSFQTQCIHSRELEGKFVVFRMSGSSKNSHIGGSISPWVLACMCMGMDFVCMVQMHAIEFGTKGGDWIWRRTSEWWAAGVIHGTTVTYRHYRPINWVNLQNSAACEPHGTVRLYSIWDLCEQEDYIHPLSSLVSYTLIIW